MTLTYTREVDLVLFAEIDWLLRISPQCRRTLNLIIDP